MRAGRGRRAARRAATALACCALSLQALTHAAALSDDAGGAGCQYYSIHGRLAWQHKGGDWVDAAARPQGPAAFAQARVQPSGAAQALTWDLDTLAQAWQRGELQAGTVMLRVVPGGAGGIVDFASRETTRTADAPSLVAVWDDGQVQTVAPSADTTLNCTTERSLGGQPIVKVSPDEAGLLAFAWKAAPGRKLRSLTLRMTSTMQYGNGATVGAYAVQLPRTDLPRQAGLSDAEPRDAGLARSADVLYAENFDSGLRWREFIADPGTADSLSVVERDPALRFEPAGGRALRVVIRKGTLTALNHHLRFAKLAGGEPEEAYFRYHLRLADNWDPVVDGGKLPGFSGTYNRAGWGNRRADGVNGWSARGAFFVAPNPSGTPDRFIGSYPTTIDFELGDTLGWNLGPTGRLQKNRWYAIEQYVKLNTPGRADGILRAWVDGQLALSRENLRYRSTEALKIESVWMNVYHGGMERTDRDLALYIDNVVIARRYIGPGRFAQ
jgi:hypothetical protein